MLIAHIPAGYITSKVASKTVKKEHTPSLVISSFIFSVWHDLDLIYFYFFDSTKTFHHLYFPHLPIVMITAFIVTLPLYCLKKFEKFRIYHILFFVNWLIHLILDTFTGGIAWLYPFNNEIFLFIDIPANFNHWIISFILHWSFVIELVFVAVALILFLKTVKRRQVTETLK